MKYILSMLSSPKFAQVFFLRSKVYLVAMDSNSMTVLQLFSLLRWLLRPI